MSTYFLRVEAVNLENSIRDTEDLSTIRGSSLSVLFLERYVLDVLIEPPYSNTTAKLISRGASRVVFKLDSQDLKSDAIKSHVDQSLRKQSLLRFSTLIVEVSANEFSVANQELKARVAFDQMSNSLSVSPVGTLDQSIRPGRPWCDIDYVRPTTVKLSYAANPSKSHVSESVSERRKYGVVKKRTLFKDLPGIKWSHSKSAAAHHFNQIAEFTRGHEEYKSLPSNLDGKIAVFYADGNAFGKIQKQIKSEKQLDRHDRRIQSGKAKALQSILDQSANNNQLNSLWWNQNTDSSDPESDAEKPIHRFETLMWGGDELLWVVPAWMGLQVAWTFFQKAGDESKYDPVRANTGMKSRSTPQRNLNQKKEAKLTYSAGLVFCHSNAPIQQIWSLAEELAEVAKEAGSREKNLLSYVVLESFDQYSDELLKSRRQQLPFPPDYDSDKTAKAKKDAIDHRLNLLNLEPGKLPFLSNTIRWMQQNFPHGSVYRAIEALRECKSTDPFQRILDRGLRDVDPLQRKQADDGRLLSLLTPSKGDEFRVNWLHLAELWDYACLELA